MYLELFRYVYTVYNQIYHEYGTNSAKQRFGLAILASKRVEQCRFSKTELSLYLPKLTPSAFPKYEGQIFMQIHQWWYDLASAKLYMEHLGNGRNGIGGSGS